MQNKIVILRRRPFLHLPSGEIGAFERTLTASAYALGHIEYSHTIMFINFVQILILIVRTEYIKWLKIWLQNVGRTNFQYGRLPARFGSVSFLNTKYIHFV